MTQVQGQAASASVDCGKFNLFCRIGFMQLKLGRGTFSKGTVSKSYMYSVGDARLTPDGNKDGRVVCKHCIF